MTRIPPVFQHQNSILEKKKEKKKKDNLTTYKSIYDVSIWQRLFLLAYFCYYSWVPLYFWVLFMSLTILFQLTITFIYSTFSKKFSISAKSFQFQQNKQIPNGLDIDYLTTIETSKHKQPLSEEKWISDKIVSHMGLVVHYLENLTQNFQYKLYRDDDDDESLNSCSWHVCYQRFRCCNLLSPSTISLSSSWSLTLSFPLFLILGFSDLSGGVGLGLQLCFLFLYFYFN